MKEERQLSQEKLAFEDGSHPTLIHRFENGHNLPTATAIFKLAEVLEVGSECFVVDISNLLLCIKLAMDSNAYARHQRLAFFSDASLIYLCLNFPL
ncbi:MULTISPECIES: helix-turn-helix transcriptional regulator [unclassified Imperialibacter]|uniref:helix-turn-helix domain-containing protein n=1 Tax=unclassified Imperialibacter TaxID=2629706 RepID=UPI00125EF504